MLLLYISLKIKEEFKQIQFMIYEFSNLLIKFWARLLHSNVLLTEYSNTKKAVAWVHFFVGFREIA